MSISRISSMLSLKEAYQVSSELNPKLWDGIHLKTNVREKLTELVDYFIDFLSENDLPIAVLDTWLVGSNASFNYTKHSDLDVHIIVNTSDIECGGEFLLIAYNAYRQLFNSKFDVKIEGIPVEVYIQDLNSSVRSNGIYSLSKGWIKEPEYNLPPTIDTTKLDSEYANKFSSTMKNPSLTAIDDLINDIYLLRKEGIASGGEYSVGNQVFKNFRDEGYLEKLKDKRRELITDMLSSD